MGILVGDKVQTAQIQADIVDKTLIARTAIESERVEKVESAMDHLFSRYDDLFVVLDEGME